MARRSVRDQVIRSAAHLIADQGLGAISLADVAKAAGIRATSVYRMFGDKNQLMSEVLDYSIGHFNYIEREIFSRNATIREKIKTTVFLYARQTASDHIERRLLFRAIIDRDHETLTRIADSSRPGTLEFVRIIGELVGEERAWTTYFVITAISAGLMHMKPFHEILLPTLNAEPFHVTNEVLAIAIPGLDWKNVRILLDVEETGLSLTDQGDGARLSD